MTMTRRQRLMATLRGEPVDRPAVNFYEVGGFLIDPADPDEFNIYNSPDWKTLLDLAWEHSDIIRLCSAVSARSHDQYGGKEAQGQQTARDEFFTENQYRQGDSKFHQTILKIAGRQMTSLTRRDKTVDTVWTQEHLLKSVEDLKAYLQLPDEIFAETINIQPLLEEEQTLGERGIVMVDTEDPLCVAATLFSMEDYTILALTEQNLFHQLLEKCARYIHARTEKVARKFPGRLWRIYGSEFAAEPYLPPSLFREYVVRYTGPMVKMIQAHGGFARIHCHGRMMNVLDDIVATGADAIDPIEPIPQGDAELAYVRQKYGDQLVLFGNLEITDIENTEPEKFEKIVEKSLLDGTTGSGRGFVLMPSAAPYGRKISAQTLKNYETMIEKTCRLATNS